MSRIRIKNFGPIKDGFRDENGNEWMDIKKVTTFIGNQGSGKSTVAKLISIFTWLEKARNRGDEIKTLTRDKFLEYFQYQGLQNYFSKESILEYSGDAFDIEVERDGFFTFFEKQKKHYIVPKIMYVPAERNFLSIV
ncbi:MAG: ATP-binding protein, partial [Flavobacterium sp.]